MKPGWKTTEFWISLFAIATGLLFGAGIIGDSSAFARIGGWIVAALGSAGYSWARTLTKVGTSQAGRAGWKTTEFWKAAGVAILLWLQSNAVPPDSKWSELIGYALAALPVAAYTAGRGTLKGSLRAMLLPFLFFGLAMGALLPSCATTSPARKAYTQRFDDCMIARGRAVATDVKSKVQADVNATLSSGKPPAEVAGQLEHLAGGGLVDTVTCAVDAWLYDSVTAPMDAGVPPQSGFVAGNAFMTVHAGPRPIAPAE